MEWRAHLFVNRLGDSWKARSELTKEEQKTLHVRMVGNYYGFWVSKAVHAFLCYKAFRWGMFTEGAAERLFWVRLGALNLGVIVSLYYIDKLLKSQLFLYCEDLREKYGTALDDLRLNYLSEQADLRMTQAIELQRLADSGKHVQKMIEQAREK